MDSVLEVLIAVCRDEDLHRLSISNGRRLKVRKLLHIISRRRPELFERLRNELKCEDNVCMYKSMGAKLYKAYGVDINLEQIETLGDLCAFIRRKLLLSEQGIRGVDDRPTVRSR